LAHGTSHPNLIQYQLTTPGGKLVDQGFTN
jgi:hypothetical protein